MSRFVKHILICLGVYSTCFGQFSVSEMLHYGDQAFENKNYASAIYFYKMIIDDELKIERVSSFPYAYSSYTGKSLKKKNIDSTQTTDISDKIIDGNEIYATHKIAECSRLLNHYEQAEEWYVKSLQLKWGAEKDEFPLDSYWYAIILMNNNKYSQAIEELRDFIINNEGANEEMKYYLDRSKKMIANCNFALSPKSKLKGITVKHGDSLMNNGTSSYAATYYDHHKILISSARNTSTEDKDKKISSNYLSDIFTMNASGEGQWEGAMNISNLINTNQHEGAASMGDDKKTMYFTRWNNENNNNSEIYVSKYFVDKWMIPRKLNKNVNPKGSSSQHPYISKNNKILFFASDMPGGQGGMDIWYCTIDRKGIAGEPVNLGPIINTKEDEITPFYHEPTGVLYFSSKGHQNIGGFDVFKASYDPTNNTAFNPINMGYPINSSKDDKYFCLSDFQTEGFVTSNRELCKSCDENFCNQIYTIHKDENEFLLSGYAYDMDTYEIIPNTRITVKDVKGEFEDFHFETDSNGFYSLPLEPEMHIFIKAQKIEYFADANVQSTIGLSESQEFVIDFYLIMIPYEEIEIPGILYDYDKATLRPESKVILDSLVDFLTINDNLIIEISSHTDENGSDSYNIRLSQKRAESVVNYIIENGILADRLIAKGYGETIPIVKNAKTEEDHQKNRRTSFRILSEDFKEINRIRSKQR